ncbi:MAG: LPS export ABC transporter permease LptF [Gammaproteobacteria bacterium]|nr:LPS export ABC transporter permease LptF [Gammaproteobacteria bacterium]
MSNILSAYLAREILKTSLATMLVLYVILMSNAFGRILADIADGDIPQQALWAVMLSQSVNILSPLLPIGVFLGIVFTLGRMYKDHEIVVMNACGIGNREIYKPVAMVLIPMFLFSAYASLSLNAQMQANALTTIDEEENRHEFQQVKPGQFNQAKDGDSVFYMDSLSDDKLELKQVILGQSSQDLIVLETAESGRQSTDEVGGDLFLVVGPGRRIEGKAGQKDFTIIDYERHGVLLKKQKKTIDSRIRSIEKNLRELWNSSRISDRVELQWRIAIPFVLLTLAILAVPLSYISPRQGRFGKFGYALLAYIVYLNLLALTRAQLEAQNLPMALNFWWVHLVFIILAAALLYRLNKGVLFSKARSTS